MLTLPKTSKCYCKSYFPFTEVLAEARLIWSDLVLVDLHLSLSYLKAKLSIYLKLNFQVHKSLSLRKFCIALSEKKNLLKSKRTFK